MARPKCLLIDGSSMLVTAYHALLPNSIRFAKTEEEKSLHYGEILHAPDGRYTNAVYGMTVQLSKLISGWRPDYVAIAFDKSRDTFRRKMYPEYKAQRKPTAEPLKEQFVLMEDLLSESGFPVFYMDNYEADDIVGSLVVMHKQSMQIRVVSKDQDYLQLVDDENDVRVWAQLKAQEADDAHKEREIWCGTEFFSDERFGYLSNMREYTEAIVLAHKGVLPSQIPDLKGIEGDASDNIPGVKGVSSAAAPLIREYGSIEGIYAAIDEAAGDKKAEKDLSSFWKESLGITRSPLKQLLSQKEAAQMSKQLAIICTSCLEQSDSIEDRLYADVNVWQFNKRLEELGIRNVRLPEAWN